MNNCVMAGLGLTQPGPTSLARCPRALARPHQLVERVERLLDRRGVVVVVELVQIDTVGLEASQAGIDGLDDVCSRRALAVGARSRAAADLGSEHDLVPSTEQGTADDLF